jgi:hypothetical protein
MQVERLVKEQQQRARELLEQHRDKVNALATKLMQKKVIVVQTCPNFHFMSSYTCIHTWCHDVFSTAEGAVCASVANGS